MELRYKLKRVNFRENTLAFDRDKRICPLYTDVHLKRVSVEQGFTIVLNVSPTLQHLQGQEVWERTQIRGLEL